MTPLASLWFILVTGAVLIGIGLTALAWAAVVIADDD